MINIKSLRNKGFHESDELILFDVNEYVQLHSNVDLTFITADDDFINAIKELLSVLSFNKFINLKEI